MKGTKFVEPKRLSARFQEQYKKFPRQDPREQRRGAPGGPNHTGEGIFRIARSEGKLHFTVGIQANGHLSCRISRRNGASTWRLRLDLTLPFFRRVVRHEFAGKAAQDRHVKLRCALHRPWPRGPRSCPMSALAQIKASGESRLSVNPKSDRSARITPERSGVDPDLERFTTLRW